MDFSGRWMLDGFQKEGEDGVWAGFSLASTAASASASSVSTVASSMSVPNGRDVLEKVRNCVLEASSERRTALITLAEQAAANKINSQVGSIQRALKLATTQKGGWNMEAQTRLCKWLGKDPG